MTGKIRLTQEHAMYLDIANTYARQMSGCNKVSVGSLIVKDNKILSFGANVAVPDLCQTPRGCRRKELYGEDSKNHRNPEDCRALHSEIDALVTVRESVAGATLYVTRYPCEACARAIVAAGIKRVIFGREQDISEETKYIFDYSHVEVCWANEWKEADRLD